MASQQADTRCENRDQTSYCEGLQDIIRTIIPCDQRKYSQDGSKCEEDQDQAAEDYNITLKLFTFLAEAQTF